MADLEEEFEETPRDLFELFAREENEPDVGRDEFRQFLSEGVRILREETDRAFGEALKAELDKLKDWEPLDLAGLFGDEVHIITEEEK